jgi:spore coat polysaccharide biosynthesis predicted glycosyltransferase SpsG
VIFGGSDTRNMTPRILMFLNKEYPALMKRVIIGKAFQNINVKEIETLRNDSVEIIYYPDARTIKKVMLNSDMAISAAGQTIYELARLGIPTIAINVADNQLVNIKKLDKHRFVYYAGSWKNEDVFRKIKSYIERLKEKKIRQDKYRLGRKIVDGKGSLRIRDYLLKGL